MTTVTIGSYPKIPVTEKNAETEALPLTEKAEAPAPAQNQEEEGVRVFSSSASARRGIPLRAVFAVRLLLAAGAGLFVWLGEAFGSAELRAAITETVQRVLNG